MSIALDALDYSIEKDRYALFYTILSLGALGGDARCAGAGWLERLRQQPHHSAHHQRSTAHHSAPAADAHPICGLANLSKCHVSLCHPVPARFDASVDSP